MEYTRIKKVILLGCLLTFVEVFGFIDSVGISFTKYNFAYAIDERRCLPNEAAFEADNVFDLIQCATLCFLHDICVSFFYEWESNKCIGCRVNLDFWPRSTEANTDAIYFHTKSENKTDCKAILQHNSSAQSGIYEVRLWKSKLIIPVFCDMETDGGGWTVFQNRFDGSVDFYRNFSEYENGFGEMNGEFWLGLKVVGEMTSRVETELRFDVVALDGRNKTENYQKFYLAKGPNYTLHFDGGDQDYGMVSDNDSGFTYGMVAHNGQDFTTYDNDADKADDNCAVRFHGGWWYYGCGYVFPNGPYPTPEAKLTPMYHDAFQRKNFLTTTKLMFR